MNNRNKLGWQLAAVATVVTLCGTSAFAEDRHRNGTRGDGEARATREERAGRIDRSQSAQQVQPQESRSANTWRTERDRSQTRDAQRDTARSDSYERGSRNDSYDRERDNRNDSYNRGSRNDSWNRSNRNDSYNRGSRNDSYSRGGSYNRGGSYSYHRDRGTPYYTHGRVSRYDRYNGGYRVWIAGAPFPFFIPEARFRLFPHFGIGVDIRLGGYYNPLGYYDYYDGPAGVYSAGYLRGVVESVDYRRGTFVLRNEETGSFVTAVMGGGDRRWDTLRPGDFVEISGDWSRSGVFEAFRLDSIGDGYYRR